MADFRRWILALAVLSLLAGAASAQIVPLTCMATVPNTPLARSEGFTEQVGDILLTCTSPDITTVTGATNASGTTATNPGLVGSITVFFNAPVTSRLLGTTATTASYSEATLLVDDAAFAPTGLSSACTIANEAATGGPPVNCTVTATAGNAGATATGTGPNAYSGVINAGGTSVTFANIPVIPPGTAAGAANARTYRITNVRVNANALSAGSITGATPITATVIFSSNAQGVLVNSSVTPAYAATSLTSSFTNLQAPTVAGSVTNLLACAAGTPPLISGGAAAFGTVGNPLFSVLKYTDNFPTAFRVRVAPQNAAPGNTAATESDWVPGLSGVTAAGPNPAATGTTLFGGSFAPGLADFGTRVKAVFTGIPTNATIWVGTTSVVSSSATANANTTPTASPAAVGMLTASETGAFSAVTGTQTIAGVGGETFVPLPNVGGNSTAVWEVTNATTGATATLNFPVAIVYSSSTSATTPVSPGSISVMQEYAPTPASLFFTATQGGAASGSLSIPRFADTGKTAPLANINACRTILMFPYLTNSAGFETGIGISNTSADPFGTPTQSGNCAINFWGDTLSGAGPPVAFAPTAPVSCSGTASGALCPCTNNISGNYCTGTITPSAPIAQTLTSMVGPVGFTGYAIAVCSFQFGHGYVSLFGPGGAGQIIFSNYLALVMPDPGTLHLGRAPGGPAAAGEETLVH